MASPLPAARRSKRSGRSRLQRWVKHAVARQSATPQVAAIEPDETLYGLFDLWTGSIETASECDSSDPAAEVLMVNGPRSPPGFSREGGGDGGGDPSRIHEEYRPEPLFSQRREELRRRNMDALHTPIVGETPEARALEEVRLANLLSTLDWRTFSALSTSVLGSGSLSPVDHSFSRLHLRYTEL